MQTFKPNSCPTRHARSTINALLGSKTTVISLRSAGPSACHAGLNGGRGRDGGALA